jgi:hypothetical protein
LSVETAWRQAKLKLAEMANGIEVAVKEKLPTLQEVSDKFLAERAMKLETKKTCRSLIVSFFESMKKDNRRPGGHWPGPVGQRRVQAPGQRSYGLTTWRDWTSSQLPWLQ